MTRGAIGVTSEPTHGVAGGTALVLAPMQFSDRLRKKYAQEGAVTGRCT